MKEFLEKIFSISFSAKTSSAKPAKKQNLIMRLHNLLDSSSIVLMVVLALVWTACVAVLVFPPSKTDDATLVSGQVSQVAYFSDFDFSYLDEISTKKARQQAASDAPLVFRLDKEMIESNIKSLKSFLVELHRRVELGPGKEYTVIMDNPSSELVGSLSEKDFNVISMIIQSDEKAKNFLDEAETFLSLGIFPDFEDKISSPGKRIRIIDSDGYYRSSEKKLINLPSLKEAAYEISERVSKNFSIENRDELRGTLANVLPSLIQPNLSCERKLSEDMKLAAENSVEPVMRYYRKGAVLIKKGSGIDVGSLNLYKAYVAEKNRISGSEILLRKFLNSALLCLFLMILNGIYLKHIHPEIFRSNKLLALTGTVVIISILANAGAITLFENTGGIFNLSPALIAAVLPLSLTSLVLSVMIGLRVGLYAGLFVSIIAALQLENSFDVIMAGMIVSAVSGFSVRHSPNHKAYFIRAALAVSLTMPLMESLHLWYNKEGVEAILTAAALGFANGLVISSISLALIFALETVFQISTDMSLLVLCDYNHPLLKKLQLEAPGTYHHSLMVATLAEQAARDIGANPVRARACALFHDIGKLQMPAYFTENCMTGSDKHEDLNPKISTMVIQNHVKEGIKLAKKHKLRRIIRDAIEQHHGTDLVRFFYQRARDENPDKETEVQESDFRYQGPLPICKEVVVVALADTCEAASRSLSTPAPGKIETLIAELIRKKIRDGQLDCADITLGELGVVRKSFVRTLTQMMHGRVKYPKDEDDEDDLFEQPKTPSGTENKSIA